MKETAELAYTRNTTIDQNRLLLVILAFYVSLSSFLLSLHFLSLKAIPSFLSAKEALRSINHNGNSNVINIFFQLFRDAFCSCFWLIASWFWLLFNPTLFSFEKFLTTPICNSKFQIWSGYYICLLLLPKIWWILFFL